MKSTNAYVNIYLHRDAFATETSSKLSHNFAIRSKTLMDNADSDQESSTQSSQEGTPRQFDWLSAASPTYRPPSSTRIDRSPPEAKSPQTPTSPRRIGFGTPITTHPVSPSG